METLVVHCGGRNDNTSERTRGRWQRRAARLFSCCEEAKRMEEE
jgi:hypothetical protein